MAHAALVAVTERLAPSADLLPDTEDVAPDDGATLYGRIAARMAADDLTDERIEAQTAAWKAIS
jgi:hypothetical protein